MATLKQFVSQAILVLSKTVETGKLDKKGKKEKERKEVGKVKILYPSLADFGINAAQAVEDGKPLFDVDKDGNGTGVPIYAEPHYDWLQTAIVDKVFAKVRNYYKDGVLQAGKVLPVDFDMLTAESARTGEALKLRREARVSFEAYLQSKGKAANVVAALGELFYSSAKVLDSASPKYIEALTKHTSDWLDSLNDEQKTRFNPKITELLESIQAATDKEELQLM